MEKKKINLKVTSAEDGPLEIHVGVKPQKGGR